MTKTKYWILNLVGGLCGLFLAANIVLAQTNERAGVALNQNQQQLNHAQQVHSTMQNFAVRIAQVGETEPVLRDLLVRHDLKVNYVSTNASNR
jgi:hypothetical protein